MRTARCLLFIALSFSAFAAAHAQVRVNTVVVVASKTRLISGEELQLLALGRDQAGSFRRRGPFFWSSSNSEVISVDSQGLASAKSLGIATISATLDGIRGTLTLQVLPLRVEITPRNAELIVGETQQFSAAALDLKETPISGATFQWQAIGANGFGTQLAGISSDGLLTARSAGRITVRALISYQTSGAGQLLTSFAGLAEVGIRPRTEFRLSRLLSSGNVRKSSQLQTSHRQMAVNDSGQIAFVASLNGMSTGLLLYEGGKFDLLASAGTPGPLPGGVIWDFEAPAINNRGEVLTRTATRGGWPSLILASRDGFAFVALETQSADGIDSLRNFNISRYSLNDNGEIVFLASFEWQGTRNSQTGLFKLSGGTLQLITTSGDRLSGLSPPINFLWRSFGIDREGVVYFVASSGSKQVLYRADGLSAPEKIVGVGDPFAESSIQNIYGFSLAPEGVTALHVQLTNGRQRIARYLGPGKQPEILTVHWSSTVHSVNKAGDVLFYGDAGRGAGLYRWRKDTTEPLLLWDKNDLGEPMRDIVAATITSQGDVFAQVRTTENDFVVARPGFTRPVLFKAGSPAELSANLNIHGMVSGGHTGSPHLIMGGQNASIFEADAGGLIPRFVSGDRVGGTSSPRIVFAKKNAAGDLYIAPEDGILRVSGGRLESILRYPHSYYSDEPFPFGGNVTLRWNAGGLEGGNTLAANDRGTLVWSALADNTTRLFYKDNGPIRTLISLGGNRETPSPAGGVFESWRGEIAIDEQGRVMLNVNVRGGPSGLFLYANGRWQAAALINTTRISSQPITSLQKLKAVNDKFYALFILQNGWPVVAEYSDQGWIPLVSRGDIAPNGNEITGIGNYDVNRRGDIAFVASLHGDPAVLMRASDRYLQVYLGSDSADVSDPFFSEWTWEIDLRDDRRVYFTGIDMLDRYSLYLAEPLF